jgi:arsenate reductase
MILFGLKNCDTCRKARKALEAAGKAVQFADVREDGVPADVLSAAFETFGEKLLNTRSTTWRELPAVEREGAPLDLIAAHPALMKRPLIVEGDAMHLGWDKSVQAALIG